MARAKVDVGGGTWLPLCTCCTWRGMPDVDRASALRQARHHELRAHPGEHDVPRQLRGK